MKVTLALIHNAFLSREICEKLKLVTFGTTFAAIVVTMTAWLVFEWVNFRKALVEDLETLAQIIGNNRGTSLPHEFTGKSHGNGFDHDRGAKEMGRALTVYSAGVGMRAIFNLELPLNRVKRAL